MAYLIESVLMMLALAAETQDRREEIIPENNNILSFYPENIAITLIDAQIPIKKPHAACRGEWLFE
ncbi:hypothetical protein ACFDR9_000160 [Janthinobacterium sp. CG_23.3]|uniref:hypothetical protein n=1 Tax=Janthinobacterium sp. CG_23.3 TaxID=3349634 RepID=UPI0038D370B6